MIQSMTGYGKAICELPNKKISIEIKSLNSKQLDLNIRIPSFYKEKEFEIRNIISPRLIRGKVEVSFTTESIYPDKTSRINTPIVKDYFNQLKEISDELELTSETDFLKTILFLPDSLRVEQSQLDEAEWEQIKIHLDEAVNDIIDFRNQEGKALGNDIIQRVNTIASLLKKIEPLEKPRINRIKERIKENLFEFINPSSFDENRFEQELLFYIEKLDISEEKTRLINHISYFKETVENESSVGKKLGFITQEIGREINTLGSKANDSDIQKLVIQMKNELEKIKEQILNIL